MIRTFWAILACAGFCVGVFGSVALAHDESARAHYIGNEGVMVVHGDTKILFDAFYSNSYSNYTLVPGEMLIAMVAGEAPYDGVDAVFVSHVHGDHFTPEPAIIYLRAHENIMLYGSKQVRDAIIASGVAEDDPLMERIVSVDIEPEDDAVSFDVAGLSIDVVSIPHSGNRPHIQNYAWRVTLDDATTVVHLGDAGTVVEDFRRHKGHFTNKKAHTAFPPYWFLGDANGKQILNKVIKADKVVGVHVPKRAEGNGEAWRKRAGGDLFTDPGETRDLTENDHQ